MALSGTHLTLAWPEVTDASWYRVRMATIGRKRERELGWELGGQPHPPVATPAEATAGSSTTTSESSSPGAGAGLEAAAAKEEWYEVVGEFRAADRTLKVSSSASAGGAVVPVVRAAIAARVYCACVQVQAGDGVHCGAWSAVLVVRAQGNSSLQPRIAAPAPRRNDANASF
jgi:hypothetical protein